MGIYKVMTIYVDTPMAIGGRFDRWCHMWSGDNNIEELNDFAEQIGLKQAWLRQSNNRFFHYDLSPAMRKKAILYGAKYKALQTWIKETT